MTHPDEHKIYDILNSWVGSLSSAESQIKFDVDLSKHKYRNMYFRKTGEFLKISQKMENLLFSKIIFGLSAHNEVNTGLVNQYLDWCFENYEIIILKYKKFSLLNIANLAPDWTPDFFKAVKKQKMDLESLQNIKVSENVFLNCEKYGLPLVSTKLAKEKGVSNITIKNLMLEKLRGLTSDTIGLAKLRNMLRSTVENEPYFTEIVFSDYQKELKFFFDKFKGEPWCKDVI